MIRLQQTYEVLGGLAALASAAAWALGSILFRKIGDEAVPPGMNLCKGIIGLAYLSIALIFLGFKAVTLSAFLLLGISGVLGIALGDTFFFKTLMYLGPRLTVLLETLGPALTVVLAVIFLRERLSFLAWVGIFLTLAGVTWVLREESKPEKIDRNWRKGITYALLSVLCMSLGILFAKKAVESTSVLQATFIRFLWAVIGITAWGLVSKNLRGWLRPFANPRLLKFTFFTVFVIIFGGFCLFLVALKYMEASLATILNSTAPLFILPFSAVLSKEKISLRAIVGAVIAVCGVALTFIR